jgi:hypothetical protein
MNGNRWQTRTTPRELSSEDKCRIRAVRTDDQDKKVREREPRYRQCFSLSRSKRWKLISPRVEQAVAAHLGNIRT